jgi:hypothetical protein
MTVDQILIALQRAAEIGYPWSVSPQEAAALVAEIERLRGALNAERAAVVAWLRAHANAPHPIERGVPSLSPAGRGLLLLHADHIERGEHRREETK